MKKSIKVIGRPVEYAFIIRDVNIDIITLEKYVVECRSDITDAWGGVTSGQQTTLPNPGDQTFEVILKDKISNITLNAKANVVELIAKMGGKIIKDIKIERAKRGKKSYISDIIFFKEVI